MKRQPRWACALVVAAFALWTSSVRANGRFPRAEQLLQKPGDPAELWLAATYGLLVTHDGGKTWSHLCEEGFALDSQYQGDPLLDVAANGALIVNVQSTLNLSLDDGCQWTPTLGGSTGYVIDYAVAPSLRSTVVGAVAEYVDGGTSFHVTRSTDNGATWSVVGTPIPATTIYTIDVAPDDPTHVFVTGLRESVGQLLTSSDDGTTWIDHPIPGTGPGDLPYIARVHPADANKIFVRTSGWKQGDADAIEFANDALLLTEDGGATWRELIRGQAKMLGFALSPDASVVLVGFGDPKGFEQLIPGPMGIFKANVDDFVFERIFDGDVQCLSWTPSGIYLCSIQSESHFEVAFSPTLDFAHASGCLTPVLQLNDVRGSLQCGAGTTGAICAANWDTTCMLFNTCGDAAPPGPPSECIAAPQEDGGIEVNGDATGRSAAGDASTEPFSALSPAGGCGCRIARVSPIGIGGFAASPGAHGFALFALASLVAARLHRRTSDRHRPRPPAARV